MKKELHIKYRPPSLDAMYGNATTVSTLKGFLKKKKLPHTMMFMGTSGCGKTTLARIIASELECNEDDVYELNASKERGIDSVRRIILNCEYPSLLSESGIKVVVIDECFAKGTPILIENGTTKPIEEINIGDSVVNLVGNGIVKNTFINKIPLKRIVKINLNDTEIFCSSDHLFMTPIGWVKACDLENNFVYSNIVCNFVSNKNKQNEKEKNKILQKMPNLQKANKVFSKQTGKIQQTVLQQSLCGDSKWEQDKGRRKDDRGKGECKDRDTKIPIIYEKQEIQEITQRQDETGQPLKELQECFKRDSYKKEKRHSEHLERKKRGERTVDKTTKTSSKNPPLGNRGGDTYRKENTIPNKLQSGCREQREEDCNRNRWKGTPTEKEQIERQEENGSIKKTRVESITFYQRGSNDESFSGIIGNKERVQGYLELYDFEVSSHPSYYANGSLVHNCHKLTDDAQNAFLKPLEDTPDHVYFILCTTRPQKLIKEIRNRCSTFEVKPLKTAEMESLLLEVVEGEGVKLKQPIIDSIVDNSGGVPREALQKLNQILAAPPKKRLAIARKATQEKEEGYALSKALVYRHSSWQEIAKILNSLNKQEAETIRRNVMGVAASVLLKGKDDEKAGLVLECFSEPLYDTGFPGLVSASYLVFKG